MRWGKSSYLYCSERVTNSHKEFSLHRVMTFSRLTLTRHFCKLKIIMKRLNHELFQYFYRNPFCYHIIIYAVGIIGLFQIILFGVWIMIINHFPSSLLMYYDQWVHGLIKPRDFKLRSMPKCTCNSFKID